MPIPLANRNGNLQTPTAEPGRVFDPSDAIANVGKLAANSYRLAAKAADDMGSAITLIQRQKEDIKAKEAYLEYEQSLSDAQTELNKRQGLAAEEYRNNEYKRAVEKAQLKFNNAMDSLNFSDIRNASVESNIKMGMSANAQADNYAYKEMISARNTMSKDLIESYKRQAKMTVNDLYSPDKNMQELAKSSQETALASIQAEVLSNASLNGLLDENYQKIKVQEAIDNFHIEMAEELSHPMDGFVTAEQYLNDNKGNMTTAAWDKAYSDLDENKLVYAIMKSPNDFIKTDGTYDEELAESIAPHLNDRERYRILHHAVSTSKSGKGTAEDVLAVEPFARRYYLTAMQQFWQHGIDISKGEANRPMGKGASQEINKAMDEAFKKSTVSEIFKTYYQNVYVPSQSKIVIRKSDGAEMPLADDPEQRSKQLAAYMMDPNTYVVQNFTALSPAEATDIELKVKAMITNPQTGKSMSDGLGRGWVTRAEYNTFDGIGEFLSKEYGLSQDTIMDVWAYMLNHKSDSDVFVDEKGNKTYTRKYPELAAYDFFEKGAYDKLYKEGKSRSQGAIQSLLTEALSNVPGSRDRQNLMYQKPDKVIPNSFEAFIQRQKQLEDVRNKELQRLQSSQDRPFLYALERASMNTSL